MVKYHFKLNNGQLGEIAGVTASAIFDIVHGKTDNPKISLLNNISQKLGVNLIWLATGTGEMMSQNDTFGHSTVDGQMTQFLKEQIREKDKIINHLMARMGKRRGVSTQPGLTPLFT
ncbi:MAG: hypothetical protein BGO59_22700 [Spirosoma sp. 48-14]|nr:MAG: hypothetical protein BGO59_22700 [Spirosoma sp. 48-14]